MTHDEFQKRMEEKYPRMFSQPYGGFAVGEGWYKIIEQLCANIEHHEHSKRARRSRDLRVARARIKGRDAVLKYLVKDRTPSDWDHETADHIMQSNHTITEKDQRVVVAQIKEKFGGLRFYYEGGDDYIAGLVTMAESWASRTCENCGDDGHQRGGGWIRTLCDTHEAEYQAKRAQHD